VQDILDEADSDRKKEKKKRARQHIAIRGKISPAPRLWLVETMKGSACAGTMQEGENPGRV